MEHNIITLHQEIHWLQQVIEQVIKSYFLQEGHEANWQDIPIPDLSTSASPYAGIVNKWQLDKYARLAMALAMAPHISPQSLDVFFSKNSTYDRRFTEFGGLIDKNHSGFLPTGQTLCFLITATKPGLRTILLDLLSKEHILMKEQILVLGDTEPQIPRLNGLLGFNDRWLYFLQTGIEADTTTNFLKK